MLLNQVKLNENKNNMKKVFILHRGDLFYI